MKLTQEYVKMIFDQLDQKEACRRVVRSGDVEIANWCVEDGPLSKCDEHTKVHILTFTIIRQRQLLDDTLMTQ